MPDEFTCSACGQTFPLDPDWSNEDALAEAEQEFGERAPDEYLVVCDDCYNRMLLIMPPKVWRQQMIDPYIVGGHKPV